MLGERLGSYRVVSKLGSGGMGTVYLAETEAAVGEVPAGTSVALKVIHPHLHGKGAFYQRFLREARLGRRLRHENVVTTFDVDDVEHDGKPVLFFAMEHVVGQTLRAMIEHLCPVPEALLREIARQVAAGLSAIHGAQIVHRDLKPENVLVTEDHQVRIMDLGVARPLMDTHSITEEGQFAGSLLYAAPEQFADREVGTSADLYALGGMLYELATGMNPFRRDDAGAVIRAHLEKVPPPANDRNPDVSPFLAKVIATLLAKEPEDRLPSAAFVEELFAAGESSDWWTAQKAAASIVSHHRPRVPVRRETALHGRDDELQRLNEVWQMASRGDGRTVVLEGEAGVGKTRLVDAFIEGLQTQDVHILYGSYPPSGGMGGLSQAILDHFGAVRLDAALAPYLEHAPALAPAYAAILRHEAPPADAEPILGDSLQALTVYLMRGLAVEKPVLWIVDDLHFSGPDSRKVVLSMARAVPGHRVMLLATARPGLPEEELAHFSRLESLRRMRLGRLSPRQVIELLRDAFGSGALAERLGGKIAYKSDGVPFFVFEMIRGLKEGQFLQQRPDGTYVTTRVVDDIEVPSAVRGLVEGRLSHLNREERAILDVAAVQGYEFDAALVARVLEMKPIPVLQSLAEMERRSGIVRPAGRLTRFDHHQVQEVVYQGVPEPLRMEYHAALAESGTPSTPDGAEAEPLKGEQAVFLASHHLRGSRPDKALPYLDSALNHLEASHRNEALVELAEMALTCLDCLEDEKRVDLLLRRAERLRYLGRPELERDALDDAERLARKLGSTQILCRVKTGMGFGLIGRARYDEAQAALDEACALAKEAGDVRAESTARERLGITYFYRADYEAARECFEQARRVAREAGDRHAESMAWGGLGVVLRTLGRTEEAREHHERNLEMARELGFRRGKMTALGNLANVAHYERRYEEAGALYEEALVLAREVGDRSGEAAILGNLAGLHWVRGRLEDARAGYDSVLLLDREIGNREGEARMLLNRGQTWSTYGELDAARADFDGALTICRTIGARLLEGHTLMALGGVDREQGRREDARRTLDQAIQVFREIGQASGLSAALESAGHFLTTLGEFDRARLRLREALDLVPPPENAPARALILCRLAVLPGGDVGPALAAYEEAREVAGASSRMTPLYLLWQATGDASYLEEAWRSLERLREQAPEARREALIQNVMLHRAIHASWLDIKT